MDAIFGLIMIVVVILLVRKCVRAMSLSGGTARPGRAREDLSVDRLRNTLQTGGLPPSVQVSFRLESNEICVGVFNADVEQWLEGDGTYVEKHVGWASGLAGLAIGGTVNAIGNSARKAAAARAAAERWRLIGSYRIYVTTARIALEGGRNREWHEVWLQDLRRLDREGTALVLQIAGQTATRIHAAPPEYWYLLLRRLAFDETPGGQIVA